LASLLVYPEDVKSALGRSPLEGMSTLEAGKHFRIAPGVFRELAARKIIAACKVRDPLSSRVKTRFSVSELDRFNAEYVSLFNLSNDLSRKTALVRKELSDRGIMPASEMEGLTAIFYCRADIGVLR
jgi:hypothetical protein